MGHGCFVAGLVITGDFAGENRERERAGGSDN